MDNIRLARSEPVYEYSQAGYLISGPQLAQPSWYQLVGAGPVATSEEAPSNVRARQAYIRAVTVRRRANRLAGAVAGSFVGRNRLSTRPFVRG